MTQTTVRTATETTTGYVIKSPEIKDEGVKTHKWTRREYYRMAELGFFEDKRVELIEGEIVEMSPMKSAHATALILAAELLREVFGKDFLVRSQLPLSFGNANEPEPDVAVVRGTARDFSDSHPKSAELIVEVSDTTLWFDRNRKAALYAKNKIEDYWILNLQNRSVEIHRQPKKDKKLGHIYTESRIFTEEDIFAPLAAPAAKIKVADLLP